MAVVVIINPDETEPFVRLRGALRNPESALKRIGAIMEAGAQEAFREQKFGTIEWEQRYPNQSEPFINIAGALQDFNAGRREPKKRRFDRRPAVHDTGTLNRSISSRISRPMTVECGTTVPYAATHQWGLVSSQPITDTARKAIAKWLLKKGAPYRGKMTFLLARNRTTLDTQVVQRPFLGVHEQMGEDITRDTAELVAEAANGGNT